MSKTWEGHRAPLARTEELIVQELRDEVLVFDLRSHKAHCLNKTAALIWGHCDGATAPNQIARLLEQQCGSPVNEDVVWFALNKLSKADLLRERINLPGEKAGLSRRTAIRRLAAGALLIPAIVSIVAPTAVSAASVTCPTCATGCCVAFLQNPTLNGMCPAACGSTLGTCQLSDTCGGGTVPGVPGPVTCTACKSAGGHSWFP